MSNWFVRKLSREDHAALERELVERGDLVRVAVEGWRAGQLMLPSDVPLLETVARGVVPEAWAPTEPTTREEAVFFSPLDPIVARGRAKELFGFDHIWEIYKKIEDVKFGRFTMPMLWDDQLVGRIDARIDRRTATLVVNGLWLEDDALASNGDLLAAIRTAVERLARFLGVQRINGEAVTLPPVRKLLAKLNASL